MIIILHLESEIIGASQVIHLLICRVLLNAMNEHSCIEEDYVVCQRHDHPSLFALVDICKT